MLSLSGAWFQVDAAKRAVTLTIHAQPGARRSEIAGLHGAALKVRVAAAPVEGRANAALIAFFARIFGVPKKQVRILSGESARIKVIEIIGSDKRPESLLPWAIPFLNQKGREGELQTVRMHGKAKPTE